MTKPDDAKGPRVLIAGPIKTRPSIVFHNHSTAQVFIAYELGRDIEPRTPPEDIYIWADKECQAIMTEGGNGTEVEIVDK